MPSEMNQNELLPCPFCGQSTHFAVQQFGEYWKVICDPCCASTNGFLDRGKAIAAWNTRPQPHQPVGSLPHDFLPLRKEELRRELEVKLLSCPACGEGMLSGESGRYVYHKHGIGTRCAFFLVNCRPSNWNRCVAKLPHPLPSSLTEEDCQIIETLKRCLDLTPDFRHRVYPDPSNRSYFFQHQFDEDVERVIAIAERSTVWNAVKEYEVCKAFVERVEDRIHDAKSDDPTDESRDYEYMKDELASMKPSLSQDALPTNPKGQKEQQ